MANVRECDSVVIEFEPQSLHYVHFSVKILWEMNKPPISFGYGLNTVITVLLQVLLRQ